MALTTTKVVLALVAIATSSLAAPNSANESSSDHVLIDSNSTSTALVTSKFNCLGDKSKYHMDDCIDAVGITRQLPGDRVRNKREVVIAAAGKCQIHVDIADTAPDDCNFTYLDIATAASTMIVQCAAEGHAPGQADIWQDAAKACIAGIKFCETNAACF